MREMKKLAQFESNFDSFQLFANVYSKQNCLIIDVVTPNEHLGGIGVGLPYLRANGAKSANFHCISIPAHRDAELAGKLARIIAKNTEVPVIVLLGIHIPNISKSQILKLSQFFEKWFAEISFKLAKDPSLYSNKANQ